MAGPLSSEEIEDVVSSVRRLVSNEQRPRTLSRDLNAERLLLTPALRVVPETSPLAPLMLDTLLAETAVQTAMAPAEAGLSPDPGPDFSGLPEHLIEETSAPVEVPEAQVQPDPVLDDDVLSEVAPTIDFPDADSSWEDEIWTAPDPVPLGEAALAADEAEVLTAPSADLDPSGSDDTTAPWVEAPENWAEGEPVPFVPLRRRAEQFAARLAPASDKPDVPKPEASQDVTDAAEMTLEIEPVAQTVLDATRGGKVATELLDEDGTPLAVLDETALTEIVRQVLRAELQGDLGERITRNVRKLVRAEINRALIARDLD